MAARWAIEHHLVDSNSYRKTSILWLIVYQTPKTVSRVLFIYLFCLLTQVCDGSSDSVPLTLNDNSDCFLVLLEKL